MTWIPYRGQDIAGNYKLILHKDGNLFFVNKYFYKVIIIWLLNYSGIPKENLKKKEIKLVMHFRKTQMLHEKPFLGGQYQKKKNVVNLIKTKVIKG